MPLVPALVRNRDLFELALPVACGIHLAMAARAGLRSRAQGELSPLPNLTGRPHNSLSAAVAMRGGGACKNDGTLGLARFGRLVLELSVGWSIGWLVGWLLG